MKNKNMLIHVGHSRALATWLQYRLFNCEKAGFGCVNRVSGNIKLINKISEQFPLKFDHLKLRKELDKEYIKIVKKNLVPVISEEILVGYPYFGARNIVTNAENIHKLYPNGKILLIIRNQIDLIVSHYIKYVFGGGIRSLKSFINDSRRGYFFAFDKDSLDYYDQYKLYIDIFGKKNLLILPYEEFCSDPKKFLKKLYKFCQLPEYYDLDFKERLNLNSTPVTIFYKKFINIITYIGGDHYYLNPYLISVPFVKKVKKIFDPLIPSKLTNYYVKRLKLQTKQMVGSYFYKSNKKLSDKINLNLKKFNYH